MLNAQCSTKVMRRRVLQPAERPLSSHSPLWFLNRVLRRSLPFGLKSMTTPASPSDMDDAWSVRSTRMRRVMLEAALVAGFGIVVFAYWVGSDQGSNRAVLLLRCAYENTAAEAVRQYRVALKRANGPELCVFAGMIASAYWAANDERTARSWKEQERADCAAAGLPSYWDDIPPRR